MPDGDSTIQKLKCPHVLGLKSLMDEPKRASPVCKIRGQGRWATKILPGTESKG